MAVYKIFPDKDTFIYTEASTANAGLDEIMELGGYPVDIYGMASRILIQFPQTKINEILNNYTNGSPFQANLRMFLASAYELEAGYTVYAYPLYESWTNGVGKYLDSPTDKSGVSWFYRSPQETDRWTTPANSTQPVGVTSSYDSRFAGGGGSWWYGGAVAGSQTMELSDDHDLNINVTGAIRRFKSGSIVNNGFIVKLDDAVEFQTGSHTRLKYYSSDTNTIYPPHLEIKWDDSSYIPGNLEILHTSSATITVQDNRGTYTEEGKQRFRLSAKPKYPVRTFTTSSIYLKNYALPQQTYWGIKDENSEEMIIDFDNNYTKVSCDSTGPYFDIYMDGLQPERYYRILIKTVLDGSTVVIDDKNIFKVVRNV